MSSTKYVIEGKFDVKGHIDKPDLIGSFFGQTEGLIGEELEFSNLQKTGKLGRIDIFLKKTNTKTTGLFRIPTALNKIEVSLVAAALESITKIGHCTGTIKITQIKDEREEKRKQIMKRAETLLENLKNKLPDSETITTNIKTSLKKKSIIEYQTNIFGTEDIETKQDIILVEGRADVANLIKNGYDNILSFNGSDTPNSIRKLTKNKTTILFLDGDNAGKKELEVLKQKLKPKYYAFAPNGKEVEELNLKEIATALKNKKEITYKNQFIKKIKKIIKPKR